MLNDSEVSLTNSRESITWGFKTCLLSKNHGFCRHRKSFPLFRFPLIAELQNGQRDMMIDSSRQPLFGVAGFRAVQRFLHDESVTEAELGAGVFLALPQQLSLRRVVG